MSRGAVRRTVVVGAIACLYPLQIFWILGSRSPIGFVWVALYFGALAVSVVAVVATLVPLVRERSIRSDPRRVLLAVALFLAVWIPACDLGSLGSVGDRAYFARRASELQQLDALIVRLGQVREMSDGQRYWKTVNGLVYRGDGENPPEAIPLQSALDSAGVRAESFEDLRQRMIRLGIICFESDTARAGYMIDGFLDNCIGFLRVRSGREPKLGDIAPRGRIISLTRVAPGWYIYRTT